MASRRVLSIAPVVSERLPHAVASPQVEVRLKPSKTQLTHTLLPRDGTRCDYFVLRNDMTDV